MSRGPRTKRAAHPTQSRRPSTRTDPLHADRSLGRLFPKTNGWAPLDAEALLTLPVTSNTSPTSRSTSPPSSPHERSPLPVAANPRPLLFRRHAGLGRHLFDPQQLKLPGQARRAPGDFHTPFDRHKSRHADLDGPHPLNPAREAVPAKRVRNRVDPLSFPSRHHPRARHRHVPDEHSSAMFSIPTLLTEYRRRSRDHGSHYRPQPTPSPQCL